MQIRVIRYLFRKYMYPQISVVIYILGIFGVSVYGIITRPNYILDIGYVIIILFGCISILFFDGSCFVDKYYIKYYEYLQERPKTIIPTSQFIYLGIDKYHTDLFYTFCIILLSISLFLVLRRSRIIPIYSSIVFIVSILLFWVGNIQHTAVVHCYYDYIYLLVLLYVVYLTCVSFGRGFF